MTEEPKWPTVDDVIARDASTYRELAEDTIELCRAAWLVSMDDPSKSPVGEVRRTPDQDGNIAIRWTSRWYVGCPTLSNAQYDWVGHDFVRGWPVIGAVPGTPAA